MSEAQNEPVLADQSFLGTLFSSNWFEAIIFACLTLVSWLAIAVLFFVYCVQRAALLLCWALSPLLFPLMAIRPLASLGLGHLMRIIGILLWPLGLALAATFTDGLLDLTTNAEFLGPSIAGSIGRGLTSLLAVAVVALWILFSTVLAPGYIQRLFAGATGPAGLVTQAGGLVANTGLPSLMRTPAVGQRAYQRAQAAFEAVSSLWQRVLPPARRPSRRRRHRHRTPTPNPPIHGDRTRPIPQATPRPARSSTGASNHESRP